jgi:ATP-binding cassette, subfamily B, bacterial PglK
MKVLVEVWRLLDRRQKRQLAAMQLLSMLMALSTVGGMAAVLPFFTMLAEPHALLVHPALRWCYQVLHFTDETRFVVGLGVLFAAGIVMSNVINLLGSLAMDRFAFRLGDALQVGLFEEYLHRDYAFHAKTHSATLTANVLYETGRVASGILRHGLILLTSVVSVLFIVGSIVLLDPLVAIIAISGLGASYALMYAAMSGQLRRNGERESREFEHRTRLVGESFGAIKELILLHAQTLFVKRVARCCKAISSTIVGNLAIGHIPRHLIECATACVLVGVALHSRAGGESAGAWLAKLSFIGLAVYRLLPALQQVFLAVIRIRAESPAFERIEADLRLWRARMPENARLRAGSSWHGRPRHAIQLSNVCYRHSLDGPAALTNLSLRIRAGTMVGFVGSNGCGKTTLADVISGLLVPQSGSIEIDGIALDSGNRGDWQTTIAYVPQQVFLCDVTLAENIALGAARETIDLARIGEVVRWARLEECVAALPAGVEATLGEAGARLSGGQRQRLGIARALYRSASVLIMDESTSALDPDAERDITDDIAELKRSHTILLIAHRWSALRHCDIIHELSNGRIVRSGTYEDMHPLEEAPYRAVQSPIVGQREDMESFDEARRLAADRG